MGFQNDKGQVFEQMGVFKSLSGLPKQKKIPSFDSVRSKSKNLMPFLLDLLGSACADNAKTLKDKARCEAGRILRDILIQFLPELARIVKEGVIIGIKEGIGCGCKVDFTIPNPTPELTTSIKKVICCSFRTSR